MKPRLEDMTPALLDCYLVYQAKMTAAKILFALTCVIRTHAEQEAYYAQGREPLEAVNAKRMTAGMSALSIDPVAYAQSLIPGSRTFGRYIVTHTRNSRHFPDDKGKSRAYDIAILSPDKKIVWDIKFDADNDNVPDYLEAAEIGRSCGLNCGAFWNGFKDYPHYQTP